MSEEKKNQEQYPQENDAIRFLKDTQSAMTRFRGVSLTAVVCAAAVVIATLYLSYSYIWSLKEQVYVIDQQSRLTAAKAENDQQRDLEIIHHVTRFHEKFYNLSPNMETIRENIEEAFSLSDESVQAMDNRRKEQQFYTKLIDNNMVEEIHVDSIRVDMSVYPFGATTFGHMYVVRESNVTKYRYASSCRLVNVARSETNPNGLRIEKVREELVEKEGTVGRR